MAILDRVEKLAAQLTMSDKAFSERVEKLAAQLTLDEKISLLAGQNFWETVPIPRLDIPSLKVSDGPNGARGGMFKDGTTAACFPASVAIAAGFDESVAKEIGRALAEETQTKGAFVLLGPTVCPHRSPLGGRNFESFSEDPLLAGRLAKFYIEGLQAEGIGATIKHFAANESETRRFTMNANISERALREIYLKPFEIAIKGAKPWCLMTSYNLVNGTHSDHNEFLLKQVLRKEWGWDGLVMSDWGGTNSTAESITQGLHLEMPGPTARRKTAAVKAAIQKGELKEEAVHEAAKAVLRLLELCGKFGKNRDTPEERAIINPAHSALIREAGAKGIVLLKNEGQILPLKKEKLSSIAAIGYAKECLAHGGGSAGLNCHYKITPWQALEEHFGKDFDLRYAQGAHTFRNLPEWEKDVINSRGEPGFTISCWKSADTTAKPDKVFYNKNGSYNPIASTERWAATQQVATYKPKTSGRHLISFAGLGPCQIYINDELIMEQEENCTDTMAFLFGGYKEQETSYHFEAGKSYEIRMESRAPKRDVKSGDGVDMMAGRVGSRLGFMTQAEYEEDLVSIAVEVARGADVALLFVGNSTAWETEGQDMVSMNLPAYGSQDKLIEAVAAVNKNVVVVNSTGVAIAMPWLNKVSAVVQAWFGGMEAGNSIVDVLTGKVNPSGKLPITIPKRLEDTPCYKNFPGSVETLQQNYEEGIYIGYRHYDKHPETIQFPFGYGASYTTFEVSNVSLSSSTLAAMGSFTVKADVKNTGSLKGSEVVQVYIGSGATGIDVPVKQLASFKKVELEAGESTNVEVEVGFESASYWNEKQKTWTVEKGDYKCLVGTSSRDIVAEKGFTVEQTFTFDP